MIFAALGCRRATFIADEHVDGGSVAEDAGTDSDTIQSTDTTDTAMGTGCGIPDEFSWTSSEPLIFPSSDAASIKDPTVVFYNGKWHVYATESSERLSMTYLSFTDWDEAKTAEKTPVSTNKNLAGYKAAPQLFYFSPDNLWYLIYQTQEPSYSTASDPGDVKSWSAPTQFMSMPSIIENSNIGGIDYWVICDDTDCYMFFSALNGVLYRARTTKELFPNGFEGTTEIIMQDSRFHLYDACNIYKWAGTDKYLLLVEAVNDSGRYFRSWTADRLDGDWTPLADTEADAFASVNNVTGADWSEEGIGHGEMLRTNPDETMTVDTCNMQYLFSGLLAGEADSDESEYYCLGLLTFAE